jgi:hypothetical protein
MQRGLPDLVVAATVNERVAWLAGATEHEARGPGQGPKNLNSQAASELAMIVYVGSLGCSAAGKPKHVSDHVQGASDIQDTVTEYIM